MYINYKYNDNNVNNSNNDNTNNDNKSHNNNNNGNTNNNNNHNNENYTDVLKGHVVTQGALGELTRPRVRPEYVAMIV